MIRGTFLLMFFFVITSCQGQTIRDNSNMLVGKIETNGIVRDRNNMMIGKFESDGDVRNKNNMLVGKIEKNGTIRDRNNMTIGKVESDGIVRDRNNMMVGKVKSDGAVIDSNNMTIGYAKDVPVVYAAVFFFFNMFEKKDGRYRQTLDGQLWLCLFCRRETAVERDQCRRSLLDS